MLISHPFVCVPNYYDTLCLHHARFRSVLFRIHVGKMLIDSTW
uniref:Uncharacterized protein n=1 Tax=Anguilla anguilla TaxID=7936 RepID=A0A0E9VJR5_ANGAN